MTERRCSECPRALPPCRAGRPRRTCSPACARTRDLRLKREATALQAAARRAATPWLTCEECGRTFLPAARHYRRARYCTARCRKRAEARRYGVTAGMRAARLAFEFVRRSSLGWSGVVERFDPVDVYERDGWLCRICGGELELSADPTRSERAPSIDHIRPVEAGGVHELGNVRAAHRGCNSARAQRDRRRRAAA